MGGSSASPPCPAPTGPACGRARQPFPSGCTRCAGGTKSRGSAGRVRVHGHGGGGAYIVRMHHTGDVHVHPRGSLNELCMVQAYERCVELSSTLCDVDASTFQEESGSAGASGTTADVFQISIRRLDLPLVGGEERHPPHLDKAGWVSVRDMSARFGAAVPLSRSSSRPRPSHAKACRWW